MASIRKASRAQTRLRMAIDGPSGGGKSRTALILATALARHTKKKVGVIDSEKGRASNHADIPLPDGTRLEFDVLELADYSPKAYVSAINEFEQAGEYGALVIDSLSHAWAGEGGALEIKDKVGGNNFTAWAEVTPMQNRLMNRIIGCKMHLISTLRTKTEYVQERDADGKTHIRRVGLAPIQRKGIEFEFNIYGSIDLDHTLRITKSDCEPIDGAVVNKPGLDFARPIIDWLETGTSSFELSNTDKVATRPMVEELAKLVCERAGCSRAKFEEDFYLKYGVEVIHAPYLQVEESLKMARKAAPLKK